MSRRDLPIELRRLVHQAVALLGGVIRRELGEAKFARIESIRRNMARLRGRSPERVHHGLKSLQRELARLDRRERLEIAHAFGLMLELMNSCENAYRTWRLRDRRRGRLRGRSHGTILHGPEAVVLVLTAHPTEARSPENIRIFSEILEVLVDAFANGFSHESERLRNLLEIAWRVPVARRRRPRVEDEADHIYSVSLRTESLRTLLELNGELAPFYLRSWVGGDKDGHPGVNEETMRRSLRLSRRRLVGFMAASLVKVRRDLELSQDRELARACALAQRHVSALAKIEAGDGARMRRLHGEIRDLVSGYRRTLGAEHPALSAIRRLLRAFPALVIPLELRESAGMLASAGGSRPIARMLATLARLSRGGSPAWYARGLIVSMVEDPASVAAAAHLVKRALGALRIPVIPLFESEKALRNARPIVEGMIRIPPIRAALRGEWRGRLEVMLGYSDSAKQMGALASRIAIARALGEIDRVCARRRLTPVFFHGSGGSVDRGGGSIEEQTAWWPRSALRFYKATIQGEMVERSFASPEILRGQIERIASRYEEAPRRNPSSARSAAVSSFGEAVRAEYSATIIAPEFLEIVQRATAYRFLDALRIGSRPVSRGRVKQVSGLRAIPWVLCWTQARVLFPAWWGVGTAWTGLPGPRRRELRRAFRTDPLFRSYVKLLGFTLAKVELGVWRLYLESSGLSESVVPRAYREFEREYRGALQFVRAMSGSSNLLWFRPWLGTSIRLRSPMIHPLNVIQVLALRERDSAAIRETVTGISSGMMTTG